MFIKFGMQALQGSESYSSWGGSAWVTWPQARCVLLPRGLRWQLSSKPRARGARGHGSLPGLAAGSPRPEERRFPWRHSEDFPKQGNCLLGSIPLSSQLSVLVSVIHNFRFALACLFLWAESFNNGRVNSTLCFSELSSKLHLPLLTWEPWANHLSDLNLSVVTHGLEGCPTLGQGLDNLTWFLKWLTHAGCLGNIRLPFKVLFLALRSSPCRIITQVVLTWRSAFCPSHS